MRFDRGWAVGTSRTERVVRFEGAASPDTRRNNKPNIADPRSEAVTAPRPLLVLVLRRRSWLNVGVDWVPKDSFRWVTGSVS